MCAINNLSNKLHKEPSSNSENVNWKLPTRRHSTKVFSLVCHRDSILCDIAVVFAFSRSVWNATINSHIFPDVIIRFLFYRLWRSTKMEMFLSGTSFRGKSCVKWSFRTHHGNHVQLQQAMAKCCISKVTHSLQIPPNHWGQTSVICLCQFTFHPHQEWFYLHYVLTDP